jgi:hypothetical protein
MKSKNKIFILLTDGVGMRNFIFTNFYNLGIKKGHEITYWNYTPFSFKKNFRFKEFKVKETRLNLFTTIYKNVRTEIELKQNARIFNDKTYLSYIFPKHYNGFKSIIKNGLVIFLVKLLNSKKGLVFLRKSIIRAESKTKYYKFALETLEREKINFLLCTNQRISTAIAPILAAKKLKIPTATFIYSWDNLPKSSLVIEPDYYFVWSKYMKEELLKYYPYIKSNQIKVTGTPQFEFHFNKKLLIGKDFFYAKYNLDFNKKYICFSGDDFTTSPYDQFYLEDLAQAVEELNNEGNQIGIIFRKCPVDFSNRYDEIIERYRFIIKQVNPEWKKIGGSWAGVMPLKKDMEILYNTIKYSELVVNVGSSMVFDAFCHQKPCAFINYNTSKGDINKWDVNTIYKYIHFKSIPSKNAVLWVNKKEDFKKLITGVINRTISLNDTQKWFEKINNYPKSSINKIYEVINEII